jgi:hypothetical protein
VVQDYRHKSLLQFIRKVVDVPLGYSKDDLTTFRSLASKQYPSLVPVIDEYLHLAEKSDSGVPARGSEKKQLSSKKDDAERLHLFDLLRQRRFFPSNGDLSDFAARVLPAMSRTRFDKMSRGDIAARIVEYLEERDPGTRESLEESMRAAMSGSQKPADRNRFLSEWEKIIKGIQL